VVAGNIFAQRETERVREFWLWVKGDLKEQREWEGFE
jgi:hypothetical protein